MVLWRNGVIDGSDAKSLAAEAIASLSSNNQIENNQIEFLKTHCNIDLNVLSTAIDFYESLDTTIIPDSVARKISADITVAKHFLKNPAVFDARMRDAQTYSAYDHSQHQRTL